MTEMTETPETYKNGTIVDVPPGTAQEVAKVYEAATEGTSPGTSPAAVPELEPAQAAMPPPPPPPPPLPSMPPSAPMPSMPPPPIGNPAATAALRLRMKVWTDPATSARYLMPTAFMRDVVDGKPVSDVMYAYAMRDEDTKLVTLRAHEWNALPFFYFNEDGSAPRATARPIDVIDPRGTRGTRPRGAR